MFQHIIEFKFKGKNNLEFIFWYEYELRDIFCFFLSEMSHSAVILSEPSGDVIQMSLIKKTVYIRKDWGNFWLHN